MKILKKSALPRKKPSQSRSQITLQALQEAFVRVLIERGYEKITIREVVAVAGVGIGTFYDYMPNLRSLAGSAINRRCTEAGAVLSSTMAQHVGLSIEQTVEHLLKALVKEGFGNPKEWTALLLLERQVSSAAALKKIHDLYVQLWASAIRHSTLEIEEDKLIGVSRMAHAISYGWYSHDLLFYIDDPRHTRSIDEIAQGIIGIIKLTVSPELNRNQNTLLSSSVVRVLD